MSMVAEPSAAGVEVVTPGMAAGWLESWPSEALPGPEMADRFEGLIRRNRMPATTRVLLGPDDRVRDGAGVLAAVVATGRPVRLTIERRGEDPPPPPPPAAPPAARGDGVATLRGAVDGAVTAAWELVTPEAAARMLADNPKNRRLNQRRVEKYSAAMTAGRWRVTSQGVALDRSGALIDGQHRLAAIVDSGVSIWLLVVRGLENEARLVLDVGKVRDEADKFASMTGEVRSLDVFAVARRMRASTAVSPPADETDEDRIAFVRRHAEAIDYSIARVKDDVRNGAVRAVVARAWYTADREKLAEFGRALSTGSGEVPRPVALLRHACVAKKEAYRSEAGRLALYLKAESALKAFLEGRPISKLYEAGSELFRLADEPKK